MTDAAPPWQNLPEKRYATVVLDPPWKTGGYCTDPKFNDGRVHRDFDFSTLSIDEIAQLPLPLTADAFAFLWVTERTLFDAPRLFAQWDLKYRFTMVWHKPAWPSPQRPGFPRYNAEFVCVGVRGKPRLLTTKGFSVVNSWPHPGRAVAKPPEFYELIRRVTPGPRLDMFARRAFPGFDAWGNEAPAPERIAA